MWKRICDVFSFCTNSCIMENMKRFLFLAVMVIFTANSVSLAAAMPCVSMDTKTVDVSVSSDAMSMPSCHEKVKAEVPDESSRYAPHCEDVCVCQHVLLSPAAVLSDFVLMHANFYSETQILVSDRFSLSKSYFPPFRPPTSVV